MSTEMTDAPAATEAPSTETTTDKVAERPVLDANGNQIGVVLEDGAEILDDVARFIRRYVVLTEDQTTATALWVLHTYTFKAAGITPYLAITSAEKQSGKSLLLEVLAQLVMEPWLTGSVSAATLCRKIDVTHPTLLLDESDAAFNGDKDYSEALRGVLNHGFKSTGTYSRCVGSSSTDLSVQDFSSFCPKAIAGIGRLPDTVEDRSIRLDLKRKTTEEKVERWRERKVANDVAALRARIESWASLNMKPLATFEFSGLEELSDRANDVWEPLLGVASVSGDEWLERAKAAALALSARGVVDDESEGVRLLIDLKETFGHDGVGRLFSAEIVAALHDIEESPWEHMTARRLATMLKPFGIRPTQIRIGDRTMKGYLMTDFLDAWSRFLPTPETPKQAKQAKQVEQVERANPHGSTDVSAVSDVSLSQGEGGDVSELAERDETGGGGAVKTDLELAAERDRLIEQGYSPEIAEQLAWAGRNLPVASPVESSQNGHAKVIANDGQVHTAEVLDEGYPSW
jgi:Protein of unknown function (DUF3631)